MYLQKNPLREVIASVHLKRKVTVDYYYPNNLSRIQHIPVLFFNDGQLLEEMNFSAIYEQYLQENPDNPLLIVGIHAGSERVMEYGTAGKPNYKGLGAKATEYQLFFMQECLLHTLNRFPFANKRDLSIAGFSLGGLTAMDTAWKYPNLFKKVGVFSGSFWWRDKELGADYDENKNRIMHNTIRQTERVNEEMKFYFECGTDDEKADRNNNGIIDSIDDTMDIINELEIKGYKPQKDIQFQVVQGGKHNGETWSKCLPQFLNWGWVN